MYHINKYCHYSHFMQKMLKILTTEIQNCRYHKENQISDCKGYYHKILSTIAHFCKVTIELFPKTQSSRGCLTKKK